MGCFHIRFDKATNIYSLVNRPNSVINVNSAGAVPGDFFVGSWGQLLSEPSTRQSDSKVHALWRCGAGMRNP